MKIYAGNMSYETSEEELKKLFEPYGAVGEVTIIKDRDTGRSKGFGFVEMASDDEARAAIEGLNGSEISGRTLNVNEARPRPEKKQGGGGRGGRRFGGQDGRRSPGGDNFSNRGGRGGGRW